MYCINCGNQNTKVTDSRTSDDGKAIRRRRECENCYNRFTTFEKIEILNLVVEKSANRKEKYDRNKVEDSILKAVNKRNISIGKINNMIRELELKWGNLNEITAKQIGADILEVLFQLDDVAYIRYASIHLDFSTGKDFLNFLSNKLG